MSEFIYKKSRARYIIGYGERYAVTEGGVVLSINATTGLIKERKLKVTKKGYHEIGLNINGTSKFYFVHRLVLEAFTIGEVISKLHIDHIDMNKTNNVVTNLRWCTEAQNREYALKAKHGDKYNFWLSSKIFKNVTTKFKHVKKMLKVRKSQKEKVYKNKADMIAKTSVPVLVNGIEYRSAREAAKMICTDTTIVAKVETVRKEIQKFLKGRRPSWSYKDKYLIGA